MKSAIALALAMAACGKSVTGSHPHCGGDSVLVGHTCYAYDTGIVGLVVNNTTDDTLHVLWWWYNSLGDSARVAPHITGQCFHFTATIWAQIEGQLWYNRYVGSTFTDAFSPTSSPHWLMTGTVAAPPDDVTIVPTTSTAC